jgi:hypothetical protein
MATANSTRLPTIGLHRTPDHTYWFNGQGPYIGVTGAISTLDKSGPLIGWAKRVTAEFVCDNLPWVTQTLELVGRQQTVDAIKSKAQAEKDAGAALGSQIHILTEAMLRGGSPDLSEQELPYLEAAKRWQADYRPKLVSLERAVLNLTDGWGGTFDIIAEIDGETWLVDIKTNKGSTYKGIYTGVYPETALQLAAYGRAEFIAKIGDAKRYRFPKIDRYAVLHLRPDAPYEKGYRLIEYDVTDAEYAAFLAALALTRWRREREKVVVGEAVAIRQEAIA